MQEKERFSAYFLINEKNEIFQQSRKQEKRLKIKEKVKKWPIFG